jgi:hypothetical protein
MMSTLHEKVSSRLIKLYFVVDLVEIYKWFVIMLANQCCSLQTMWVQIPLREEQQDKNMSAIQF